MDVRLLISAAWKTRCQVGCKRCAYQLFAVLRQRTRLGIRRHLVHRRQRQAGRVGTQEAHLRDLDSWAGVQDPWVIPDSECQHL